jgi:hypothetical protein
LVKTSLIVFTARPFQLMAKGSVMTLPARAVAPLAGSF